MVEPTSTVIRSPSTTGEASAQEFLVLNLATGSYHGLNAVGRFIWERLDGTATLQAIAREVAAHFGTELERAEHDVCAFAGQLCERQLAALEDSS